MYLELEGLLLPTAIPTQIDNCGLGLHHRNPHPLPHSDQEEVQVHYFSSSFSIRRLGKIPKLVRDKILFGRR